MIIISSISIIIISLYLFFYNPYNDLNPQPVTAQRTIDFDKRLHILELTSPAPMLEMELYDGNKKIHLNPSSRNHFIQFDNFPSLISYDIESKGFLNRQNIEVQLKPEGEPYRINLTLISDDDFVLYDSNFPFERDLSGKEYSIYIGVNPPIPLSIQLTLPKNNTYKLIVNIEYLSVPIDFRVTGDNIKVKPLLKIKKSIYIKT